MLLAVAAYLLEQGATIPLICEQASRISLARFGLALLARNMAEEQTVYKLQSPGSPVWGRPFRKDELRTLAKEYVAAMRVLWREDVASFGGEFVAFESVRVNPKPIRERQIPIVLVMFAVRAG